eukprot:GHVQ01027262.1.p1 GENE.GHVQ01027262.1~~GHVQ01027262.1.p1  ORF type:complete len:429 (-),score=46.11 GHVQ01027262.1:354-1640(-)
MNHNLITTIISLYPIIFFFFFLFYTFPLPYSVYPSYIHRESHHDTSLLSGMILAEAPSVPMCQSISLRGPEGSDNRVPCVSQAASSAATTEPCDEPRKAAEPNTGSLWEPFQGLWTNFIPEYVRVNQSPQSLVDGAIPPVELWDTTTTVSSGKPLSLDDTLLSRSCDDSDDSDEEQRLPGQPRLFICCLGNKFYNVDHDVIWNYASEFYNYVKKDSHPIMASQFSDVPEFPRGLSRTHLAQSVSNEFVEQIDSITHIRDVFTISVDSHDAKCLGIRREGNQVSFPQIEKTFCQKLYARRLLPDNQHLLVEKGNYYKEKELMESIEGATERKKEMKLLVEKFNRKAWWLLWVPSPDEWSLVALRYSISPQRMDPKIRLASQTIKALEIEKELLEFNRGVKPPGGLYLSFGSDSIEVLKVKLKSAAVGDT